MMAKEITVENFETEVLKFLGNMVWTMHASGTGCRRTGRGRIRSW